MTGFIIVGGLAIDVGPREARGRGRLGFARPAAAVAARTREAAPDGGAATSARTAALAAAPARAAAAAPRPRRQAPRPPLWRKARGVGPWPAMEATPLPSSAPTSRGRRVVGCEQRPLGYLQRRRPCGGGFRGRHSRSAGRTVGRRRGSRRCGGVVHAAGGSAGDTAGPRVEQWGVTEGRGSWCPVGQSMVGLAIDVGPREAQW